MCSGWREGEGGVFVISKEKGVMKIVQTKKDGCRQWVLGKCGVEMLFGGEGCYGGYEHLKEDEVVRDGIERCGEVHHCFYWVA